MTFRPIALILICSALLGCLQITMPKRAHKKVVARRLIGPEERRELQIKKLQGRLANRNIQTNRLGQKVKIIIYADNIFRKNTPMFHDRATEDLHLVVEYLNCFNRVAVRVEGYTDNDGQDWRNIALSRHRAQHIAKYIREQDLDVRLLSAEGFGPAHPIASNKNFLGKQHNDRIEINFWEMSA